MALIVEDGSEVANANSYASLAVIAAYAIAHGDATWALATGAEQNAAALNAMVYIDSKPYKGYPTSSTQLLEWPRFGVVVNTWDVSSDAIPAKLVYAQCVASVKALAGSLSPDLARGGGVKRQKVDVIETEYFDGAVATTTYQVIDQLLAPLLKSSTTLVLA